MILIQPDISESPLSKMIIYNNVDNIKPENRGGLISDLTEITALILQI
ncbi:MAG: hypothetical protein Ct9H300mP2_4250 [Candidatus Neomarinimicrobiota bacterium]|nr:MAG: hypothetical protein Ct9H300mP2_4250 [Candidatus Neomarinimicrobiota bacterium]